MEVYHGTAANFPPKQLTGGPDTAALLGKPMPGLWLTKDIELAASYASWSADCTGDKLLRVISLEMADDCPRFHNPSRPQDFVIRHPEHEYENGRLKVLRGYRVRRRRLPELNSLGWELQIPELKVQVVVPSADIMEALPPGTYQRLE